MPEVSNLRHLKKKKKKKSRQEPTQFWSDSDFFLLVSPRQAAELSGQLQCRISPWFTFATMTDILLPPCQNYFCFPENTHRPPHISLADILLRTSLFKLSDKIRVVLSLYPSFTCFLCHSSMFSDKASIYASRLGAGARIRKRNSLLVFPLTLAIPLFPLPHKPSLYPLTWTPLSLRVQSGRARLMFNRPATPLFSLAQALLTRNAGQWKSRYLGGLDQGRKLL